MPRWPTPTTRLSSVFVAALMWLQHDVSTAFWSHIYTVLAILITTFITMASGQLARSHAYNAALLIGSRKSCLFTTLIKDITCTSSSTLHLDFCCTRLR